jgi:putative nucleotidyltransferase with HDIG domain
VKLVLAPAPRPGLALLVETGLADVVLPELPKLRLEVDEHHRHKDVYEHSLTVLEQAIALEDGPDGPVPGPDLVLRLAALLHDIGKPKTRRFEPGGGVSFHHHEVVGAQLTKARMKALRFDKSTTADVSRLVELHLRFHGYGEGNWTDSAVRRYVTDAGPLLDDCTAHPLRLHDPQPAQGRAAARGLRLAGAADRASCASGSRSTRCGPDLDGNAIMEILGVPPGPVVGRAWQHLKSVRLDRGPLSHDEAVAELQRVVGRAAGVPRRLTPERCPGEAGQRSSEPGRNGVVRRCAAGCRSVSGWRGCASSTVRPAPRSPRRSRTRGQPGRAARGRPRATPCRSDAERQRGVGEHDDDRRGDDLADLPRQKGEDHREGTAGVLVTSHGHSCQGIRAGARGAHHAPRHAPSRTGAATCTAVHEPTPYRSRGQCYLGPVGDDLAADVPAASSAAAPPAVASAGGADRRSAVP